MSNTLEEESRPKADGKGSPEKTYTCIDSNAEPRPPNAALAWTIVRHKPAGSIRWNPAKQAKALYHLAPPEGERKVRSRVLHKQLKRLAGKPRLNATVLDYLLAHLNEIPGEWKERVGGKRIYILFLETVYEYGGVKHVRCLSWKETNEWCAGNLPVSEIWDADYFAALAA